MDIFRRKKFDEAMFAKNRTLAIRVGQYQSSDIKEASFDYGYIKGDTYKPGGTCAGSGKITFTSIITTFNKLDKIYPEIGLLVDGTYEWVKMGEYFINDIEIDRNRNTTKLDLMDGMFKLNREHVTDLTYPAEIRHVIKEICLKTGVKLASENMDITSMNYRIESIPKEKKMTFRDVLSLATQMLGMSCFFNREGKLEIKELTDSGITITADSYFMHGLTKSEVQYQIAGITCKKDKEVLTVGMRTGRSLELDNLFMSQAVLDNLYHKIKDIRYYPFNLNYQGHLLLNVGEWVTIKTNTDETFKSPVLSQSFTFKGGLRGRISADSKAGNDAQYSYAGTITKKIVQFNEFEKQIQNQIEEADKGFDQKVAKIKKDFSDQVELAKAKAEEVKQELSETINQRFDSFDNGPLKEAKRKAEEALKNAGASSLLAQEAKQIGLDSVARLEAFKSQATSAQTALSGDLDVLKRTIANDIRPKQAQAEAEIAKQVESLVQTKKELAGVKSAQATYEETTTRRLSELTNLANGKASKSELTQTADELASKIASVKVGGRNYYRDSEKVRTSTRFFSFPLHLYLSQENVGETWTLSFDIKFNDGGEIRPLHFYHYQNNRLGLKASADITPSKDWQRFTFTGPVIFPNDDPRYSRGEMALYDYGGNNNYSVRRIKLEKGTLATDWSPAIEDTEGQISAVESNFRQRADSLDASVRSLTEGLRTKADISALNVTAENIRQSVKSLETNIQNKLDQKLSQAEFEVRAGSIRQEILNATKDKADKTLVTAEAGKLREEFSSLRVGGTNLLKGSKGPFLPDRKPANFDNNVLYAGQTSIYMEQGQEYIISAKTNGNFTAHHDGNKESDNVVLWIMDKDVRNYQIVSDLKTGTTGTKIIWNKPTGIYHLRVNTYHKNAVKSVWDVKVEKGTLATDWSPAPEDTDGLITEAKAAFERTAQGLRTDLSAIQEYVNKDGQRQEALQRYAREESAKQATAVRELVTRDYVGKATYQEDVKGINQKIEAVKTSANKDIASQIASYRQSVDGKFTDISSQITTYKQDLGGQISGLSNRLTSSEQGTTTQISNLKTQVATNKDNAERQMDRISDQVSANKANADSQFANVSNQLARKVETTDFQRVKETSQLYERILGNTENGIADKVARMAMTNQLFQVEVGKAFAEHQNLFLNSTLTKGFLGNNGIINVANAIQKEVTSDFISVDPNEKIIFQHWVTLPENGMAWTAWQFFDKNKNPIDNRKPGLNAYKTTVGKQHNINQITVPANAYFVRFSARMYDDGLIKVEKGSIPSDYSVALNDALEAVKTVQRQLDGSWSVQNINSAGDIISGINLGANGHNRFDGKLTHITGETLIDRAVIKSAMIDKLKTANFEAGSVTTTILDAEAVTAEKLKVDNALIRKITANDAFIDQLTSKRIFTTKIESVISSSTFLEAYKGWIGGFQIGVHESGSGRWITGRNHFSVGLGNGEGGGNSTAIWVNWGNSWHRVGDRAWYVKNSGQMFCYNTAEFWNTPIIHGNLRVTGEIYYNNSASGGGSGYWISSPKYSRIEPSGGNLYLYYSGSGYDWIPMNKEISDRRYKSNIQDSPVSGLDVIEKLKTYSYRKEYDGKIEDISCGIMAQDVQKYVPEAFYENPDGAYSYRTFELVPYLIKAIQELNQKIEKMEKTIA